jgi:hypothetical protein
LEERINKGAWSSQSGHRCSDRRHSLPRSGRDHGRRESVSQRLYINQCREDRSSTRLRQLALWN